MIMTPNAQNIKVRKPWLGSASSVLQIPQTAVFSSVCQREAQRGRERGRGEYLFSSRGKALFHIPFSTMSVGFQSMGLNPFQRGHLRPLENVTIYCMNHNRSKITIVK